MSRSKKGGGYEREICKKLSIWWSGGTRDDIFWRTAGSGAQATTRKKKGKRTADSYGDVMSRHTSGKPLTNKTVISLKRGYTGKKTKKKLNWASVLDMVDTPDRFKTRPALKTWWKELSRDIKNGKRKRGLLIFRRDRKESVIAMSKKTFHMINEQKPFVFPYFGQYIMIEIKGFRAYLMKLDNFLAWCDPQILGAPRRITRRNMGILPGHIKLLPKVLIDDKRTFDRLYKYIDGKRILQRRR